MQSSSTTSTSISTSSINTNPNSNPNLNLNHQNPSTSSSSIGIGIGEIISERISKTPSIFYQKLVQPIPIPLNLNLRKILTSPRPNSHKQPESDHDQLQKKSYQKQKQIIGDSDSQDQFDIGGSNSENRSKLPPKQPLIIPSSTSTPTPIPREDHTIGSNNMFQIPEQDPWHSGRMPTPQPSPNPGNGDNDSGYSTVLLIFIPVMVVILTVLLGLVVFLVAVLYMRRRKSIRLTEDGGPLDLSKSDGVIGEGGVEGVESRWLETLDPDVKEAYKRAKDWQLQYPPASVPTDITLSQFLSIQEKGVSAWSFEPDYEDNLSLYVQSRTEITFLADGPGMPAREGGGNSVMANLPLPKLNEVYYWEVKMYDKPSTTEVAIGLATKPYPSFRLPGWNKYSIAYFASDGFKSHNYPFTASSYGPSLNEGDVLGIGYKPRTGTVFFTRNGRKLDDAYTGLQRLNLFPTIGSNGPCTIHVNLGQAGFVFIEANVKKWGLAPMVGTLAPPPAYGSERGSILLDAGYGTPHSNSNLNSNSHHMANQASLGGVNALLEAARSRSNGHSHHRATSNLGTSAESSTSSIVTNGSTSTPSGRRNKTPRRSRQTTNNSIVAGSSLPVNPSPLREATEAGPGPSTSNSRSRRTFGQASTSTASNEQTQPLISSSDAESASEEEIDSDDLSERRVIGERESSPIEHNPPTPNLLDISMHSLRNNGQYFSNRYSDSNHNNRTTQGEDGEASGSGSGSGSGSSGSDSTARPGRLTFGTTNRPAGQGQGQGQSRNDGSPPPPGYAPLDPHVYAAGLPGDLPEEMVNQAIAAMSGDSNITPAQIQAAAQAVAAQAQANAQANGISITNNTTTAPTTNSNNNTGNSGSNGNNRGVFSWFTSRI